MRVSEARIKDKKSVVVEGIEIAQARAMGQSTLEQKMRASGLVGSFQHRSRLLVCNGRKIAAGTQFLLAISNTA